VRPIAGPENTRAAHVSLAVDTRYAYIHIIIAELTMAETVNLEFIAAQQRRIFDELTAVRVELAGMRTEFVAVRDDFTVLTAITTRHENTTKAVLEQLRAMILQQGRFNDHLRQLEEPAEA
jgi:hypothetical protein